MSTDPDETRHSVVLYGRAIYEKTFLITIRCANYQYKVK